MSKYMLISVVDREIMTEQFDSIGEAWRVMRSELIQWGRVPEDDLPDSMDEVVENETEFGIGPDCAWANDGINHADCDWRIVTL